MNDLKNVQAESIRRGRMLVRLRNDLINVRDNLDDQGDIVAFGSTNDCDDLKAAIQRLDDFNWEQILAEQNERCIFETNAANFRRAEEAVLLADELADERDALLAFAKAILAEVREALDLDGGTVQDLAVKHGLLVETKYDPAIHGENDFDAEPGDPWFVHAGPLATARAGIAKAEGRQP